MPVSYNEYVKRPGLEIEYTPEMIRELNLCYNDRLHFIKEHIKIVTGDFGVVKFGDYIFPFQNTLVKDFINYRFNIDLCGRQQGKTTIVGSYLLSYVCFEKNKTIGIVSNKEDSAKSFLSRIKYMYEDIPSYLKPGVIKWAEKSVEFDNHCKILVSATSKDSFRGEPLNCLVCDELAFVAPNWKADEFWKSNYPTISASETSKIIIISTSNGVFNLFHRLYTGAESKTNSFHHRKFNWRSVPSRDDAWAEEQKNNLGKLAFAQEYDCEFLGSSATVIDTETLKVLQNKYIEPIKFDMDGKLRIYEFPNTKFKYAIGVDCAKGTGKHFSTCQVLKIISTKPLKLKQVCVYQNNYIDIYSFAAIVNRLSYYYNNAFLMVENNSMGSTVVTQIWWEYENENLVNTGNKIKDLGIRATRSSKPKAVLFMKKLIENNDLEIIDKKTIDELSDFIDKKGKFVANNFDDDLVSGLYWSCYLFQMDIIENVDFLNKKENDDVDIWGILSDVNDYRNIDDYQIINDSEYNTNTI